MTDPIQQTQGQQQGQQQYHDDILGGEDIFAPIPEIPMEEDLPYGDVLEKKYQFEPISEPTFEPEMETKQVQQSPAQMPQQPIPQQQPAPQQSPVQMPQQQPTQNKVDPSEIEDIANNEVQDIVQQVGVEQETVDTLLDTQLQTDVQKKFGELFFTTKRIYALKTTLGIEEDSFAILGADNDKVFISYRFFLDQTHDPTLVITKIEQNKTNDEETNNELRFVFNQEALSLEVMVNDAVLFDEIQDFTEDQKKKMQVSEKLNKFIFLASEEQKKLEKEIQIKEEEERERRRLQDIFRNF